MQLWPVSLQNRLKMYAFSISTVNQLQTIQTSSVAYSFKKFFISKKAQTVTDDPVFFAVQFSSVVGFSQLHELDLKTPNWSD